MMFKNLLVTGGCGFIASNFINYYIKHNPTINIINVDAMYYCASEANINNNIRDCRRYKFVKGNICSYDLMSFVLNTYEIDSVIHFAAQSHVQNSFSDALQYTQDNIVGTHTLLEACHKYGKIKRFVHVSTDEVYGESLLEDSAKKTEQSILCPTNPYAATKAGAELIAHSYYHSFKMPIIITRGNNVYGPNQYYEKLIPRFVKLLMENQKVTIQGDGKQVRAFLYVEDVCRAFECVFEKGVVGEIYNIGCDDIHHEYTVREVAEILIKKIKQTDNYDEWIEHIVDRPFNDKRYFISNDKLKNLGWVIQWSFDKGTDSTIEWYKSIHGTKYFND